MVLGSSSRRWKQAAAREQRRLREDPEYAAERARRQQQQARTNARVNRWASGCALLILLVVGAFVVLIVTVGD